VVLQLGTVDRSNDRPPYKQIADQLRAAIALGRLAPGDKLPSEADLVDHYDVSRMTTRQAIQELRSEGLVDAKQGLGVFVRRVAPIRRLASDRFARRHRQEGKAAFIAEAEKAGVQPSVDQIRISRAVPESEVQERLGLPAGAEVIVRARRYLANGIPVETAVSYIPADIADGTAIAEMNTGPGGIYARIEEAGHILDRFTEEVSARMPTPEERRDLELGASVPVLRVLRTAYDTAGRAVEVCDTIKAAPAYLLEYELPAR
jgi:GntR family transcriptional regulator